MDISLIHPAFKNRLVKRLLFITLSLLFITVFTHIFYYQPQINSHQKLKNQVDSLKQQLLTLKKLNDPKNNLEALSVNVNRLKQKLNYSVDSLNLSKLIHELSKKSGIKIKRQTNSENTRDQRKILKQTLAVEGSYRQLRAFIDGVYQLPSFTIIQQASIQKQSGKRNYLSASLLVLTYQGRAFGHE